MMTTVYELSSAAGSTVVFLAVLLLSLGLALGLYAVIIRYSSRRALFQGWHTFPPITAALVCAGVFGLLFKGMHVTLLEGFYRVERAFGAFSRTLTLPKGIDPEAINASFDRGVLEVRIPKPEERKPRRIEIAANGPKTIEA